MKLSLECGLDKEAGCRRKRRFVSQGCVVRYHGRYLQLQPSSRLHGPWQEQALVYEAEDGTVEVRYRGAHMAFEEIPAPRSTRKCSRNTRS